MAELYPGDTIKVTGEDTLLRLITETEKNNRKSLTAHDGEYTVKSTRSSWLKNLAAFISTSMPGQERIVSATTRSDGKPQACSFPTISLCGSNKELKLVAGDRNLHIHWRGGEAPFRVWLRKDNQDIAPTATDAPQARSAVLNGLSLAPGDKYELALKDKKGVEKKDAAPLGLSFTRLESLEVVAPDALPPMPGELAAAPLPDELRQLLYAQWLAQQEGGAWLLEAQQIAAALAANYPPAQQWLQQWSSE